MTGSGRVRFLVAVLVPLIAVVVVVFVLADGDSDSALEVPDGIGDCREPGRDIGFRCDEGAEVVSVLVTRDGDRLVVDIELDQAPTLEPDREWRIQFNAASASGKVCGMSNVTEDGDATTSAVAYGYDPAFGLSELTRRALPAGVCTATLTGPRVVFTVDMSDQPAGDSFRVVGFSRVEFLADDDRPGSEDDFGFDVDLSTL